MGEEAHLIKMSGPHTKGVERFPLLNSISHEMNLHKSIQKLESESAHAVNIWLTAKLIGGTPMKMMCVDGGMTHPIVPSTGIKWKYFNHIGFGQVCDEFAIRVDGTTAVSDKQKQYSKTSHEAKLCSKLTMEAQKIHKEMKYQIGVPLKSKMQQKFSHITAEQVKACTINNNQKFAFDQAVISFPCEF